ncbi:MAG: PaaI family thioesterase [Reyranellaceae bacterium]
MTAIQPRSRQFSWRDPARTAAAAARMAGIDFLQAVVRGEYRAPIQDTLEMELTAIEPGRAEYRLRPQEFHFNPAGTLHGGVMATIVDSAMSCALWSTLEAGIGWTTMELKLGLLRTVTLEAGELVCVGALINAGNRSGAAEARVHDAKGRLCAYASTTCMVFRPERGR